MDLSDVAVIRDESEDIIKAGALRTTWGTGVVAVITAIVTAWDSAIEKVLGENPTVGQKLTLLIAAMAAWVILAGIDTLARAYGTAKAIPRVVPAPSGIKVKVTKGTDELGYSIVAIQVPPNDPTKPEFLVVKPGKTPSWVAMEDIEVTK